MYLSCLQIDTSGRQGRTWLANAYRIHQRLCLAYPDGEHGRILFRVEEDRDPARIIVQAPREGDWRAAFTTLRVLLDEPVQKRVELSFASGQRLRFFLRANPTKRLGSQAEKAGKRVAISREEELRAWLERKGVVSGFRPFLYTVHYRGQLKVPHGSSDRTLTLAGADFEGGLEVTAVERFAETLEAGIGSAKGLGFGLLSLAR